MNTALKLQKDFDLIWAQAKDAADWQSLQTLKLKVGGEHSELLQFAFAVFGGLACPIPRNLTVDLRKQQIDEDLLEFCKESVKHIYSESNSRSRDFGKVGTLTSRLHHLMWERDRLEGQDAVAGEKARLKILHTVMGFHDFFSGNKRKVGVNVIHWHYGADLALAFSQEGGIFWINGCYIRFNELWQEYIVSHPDIGTCGGFKEFAHARDECNV